MIPLQNLRLLRGTLKSRRRELHIFREMHIKKRLRLAQPIPIMIHLRVFEPTLVQDIRKL